MANIIDKLLRAGEGRILAKLRNYADAINALEVNFTALSDEELQNETVVLRERYAAGESLDDMLPEAFAAVREAAKRTLGMRPFDVQLMGGAALHLGNIAEMRTGEGKTLVATLPVLASAQLTANVSLTTGSDANLLAQFRQYRLPVEPLLATRAVEQPELRLSESQRLGLITLIYKGGGKPRADAGSYRPITLLTLAETMYASALSPAATMLFVAFST